MLRNLTVWALEEEERLGFICDRGAGMEETRRRRRRRMRMGGGGALFAIVARNRGKTEESV